MANKICINFRKILFNDGSKKQYEFDNHLKECVKCRLWLVSLREKGVYDD